MHEIETLGKRAVVDAFRERLLERRQALASRLAQTHDEATSDETKQESKYDTRALEASYLASGQGRRLAEIDQLLGWFEAFDATATHRRVGMGSLVHLVHVDGPTSAPERWLFVAPVGGDSMVLNGPTLDLVGVGAPLAQSILHREADEEVELRRPSGVTCWVVDAIY